MIISEIIKIKKIDGFDNLYVETELKSIGLNFVRWAIVDIDDFYLYISVSLIS